MTDETATEADSSSASLYLCGNMGPTHIDQGPVLKPLGLMLEPSLKDTQRIHLQGTDYVGFRVSI